MQIQLLIMMKTKNEEKMNQVVNYYGSDESDSDYLGRNELTESEVDSIIGCGCLSIIGLFSLIIGILIFIIKMID